MSSCIDQEFGVRKTTSGFQEIAGQTHAIVGADALGFATSRGYKLVETIKRACTEVRIGAVLHESWSMGTQGPNKYHQDGRVVAPAEEVLFVVERGSDEAFDSLRKALDDLDVEHRKAAALLPEMEKRLASREAAVEVEARAKGAFEQALIAARAEKDNWRDRANRLEADVAKLRKEFGELRVRQVLEGDAAPR